MDHLKLKFEMQFFLVCVAVIYDILKGGSCLIKMTSSEDSFKTFLYHKKIFLFHFLVQDANF